MRVSGRPQGVAPVVPGVAGGAFFPLWGFSPPGARGAAWAAGACALPGRRRLWCMSSWVAAVPGSGLRGFSLCPPAAPGASGVPSVLPLRPLLRFCGRARTFVAGGGEERLEEKHPFFSSSFLTPRLLSCSACLLVRGAGWVARCVVRWGSWGAGCGGWGVGVPVGGWTPDILSASCQPCVSAVTVRVTSQCRPVFDMYVRRASTV